MKEKTEQSKHYVSLAALFILGDSVLFLPGKGSGKNVFLGAVAAIGIAFLLYAGIIPLLNLFLQKEKKMYSKITICVFSVLFAIYAFYEGVHGFQRFVRFASEILLPKTDKVWIVLIFLAVVLYLISKRNEVTLKLSLLLFGISFFVIVLFLLLSEKDFKISNIAIYAVPRFGTLAKETLPFLKSITLPALLIPVYLAVNEKKVSYGVCLKGLSAGSVLLIACFAECLLLFGVALSARFPYPLYSAVSTVTVGPLFTRMDGVIYYLFFATSLAKTTLCFRLAVSLLNHVRERMGKKNCVTTEEKAQDMVN